MLPISYRAHLLIALSALLAVLITVAPSAVLRGQHAPRTPIPLALNSSYGFGGGAGLKAVHIGAQLRMVSVGLTVAYESLRMEGRGYGVPPPGSTTVGIEQAGELGLYVAASVVLFEHILLTAGPDFIWTAQRMKWTHGQSGETVYTEEPAKFRMYSFASVLLGPIEDELWIGAGYGSHRSLFFSLLFTFE